MKQILALLLIGFALSLCSAMSHAMTIMEMVISSVVARLRIPILIPSELVPNACTDCNEARHFVHETDGHFNWAAAVAVDALDRIIARH